ncbi:hypothetical protein Cni_G21964 [Canna indica]|uniref:FHA domain-containing protein n=1 Tax=Canna indica TaxID=4628 RepID=A0AAQ3KR36_9LILI|nr:hypothetical protein Cni_G21964 [Canna indica]
MLAPMTKWLPEDDLLLKNAVEAGASLQSLAKGAVQFSRRFTIQELQDRWLSLLYDLDTSEDASARIIEIESQLSLSVPSKANKNFDSKIMQTSFGKRKSQSVQSYYYAMRKRVCSNPCTSANLDFLVQPGLRSSKPYTSGCEDQFNYHNRYHVIDGIPRPTKFSCEHPETGYESYIYNSTVAAGDISSHAEAHVDSVADELSHEKMEMDFFEPLSNDNLSSEFTDSNALHQLCHSSPPLELPSMTVNEDNDACDMPTISYCNDKVTRMHSIDDIKIIHSSCVGAEVEPQVDGGASETCLVNPHVVSGNDMAFLSPHMNCHEDDHLLVDVDAYIAEKPCFDNLESIFLSSPNSAREGVLPNSNEHIATEVSKTSLPDTGCCGEPSSRPGGLNSSNDNSVSCSYSAAIFPLISPKASCNSDPFDGYLVCVLNAEDQEIPCNDHALLPLGLSHGYEEDHNLGSCAMGFPVDGKISVGEVTTENKEQVKSLFQTSNSHRMNLEQLGSGFAARIIRQDTAIHEPNPSIPATSHLHSKGSFDIKEEIITSGSRRFRNYKLRSSYCSADANVYNALQGDVLPSHAEKDSEELRLRDELKIPPHTDKEELFSDSKPDIPRFADIEAMILAMDLDLYNQGSCPFNMEASRYQSEESKKAIIRLEQGARSFVNRAISSRRALAILYGRHLKYFIRKPQVLMGRATQDVKVDIDLGLEGRTNTVSRRQATIKMDRDGSFVLKNIGKFSVFVNGKEVPARSSIYLKSESLIEVRDMTFMFEVNLSAVRQYITKMQGQGSSHVE